MRPECFVATKYVIYLLMYSVLKLYLEDSFSPFSSAGFTGIAGEKLLACP